jgi:hypothetical protein
MPDAPAASYTKVKKHTSKSPQVHRIDPAFPAQWFYGLLRALPGEPGLLSPSRRNAKHHRQLTPASGRQDHTTSPSASMRIVFAHPYVHRIPRSTFVTIAIRPSEMRRDGWNQ